MDLGTLGSFSFTWEFVASFLSIVLIDLILAGDNAVIIAMAVRSLPKQQRTKGIAFGAGAAVILRVILTFFAAQLLQVNFIKFAGGAVIIWIAIKLFIEGAPDEELKKVPKTLMQAVWVIIIADLTMSTDNVLAVAGASKGNLLLLLFGLGLSIPFVVFTSNLLARLMDKFPFIIYIGAAVLGRVGGEMMISDPFIVNLLHPTKIAQYTVEALFTVGVIVAGKVWIRMRAAREERQEPAAEAVPVMAYRENVSEE
jgi:YjbE family integral membrane protein